MSREITCAPDIKGKAGQHSPFYDVIRDAYRVFKYPKPRDTGVCEKGCCMTSEIAKDFYSPHIGSLSLGYVQEWFNAACDPKLPKAIWGYLLPRILEVLAVGDEAAPVALEVSLSRFPTGDSSMWSKKEWAVLDRFQRLYLTKAIHQAAPVDFLDDVLCMFGTAKWPLEELFAQVMAFDDEILVQRLWKDWCDCNYPSIWITAFWEKEHKSEVLAFYTARPLYDRMVAYGMAEDTPKEMSGKALDIADTIRIYAGWRKA